MAVFAVIMTASFLVHEIAHKIVAQQKGYVGRISLNNLGFSLDTCFGVFAFQNDFARCDDDWRFNP